MIGKKLGRQTRDEKDLTSFNTRRQPPRSGARPSGLSLRSRISVWLDCRLGVILLNVQFSCFGFPLSFLDYAFPVLLQTLGKRRFSSRTVPHGVAVPRFI